MASAAFESAASMSSCVSFGCGGSRQCDRACTIEFARGPPAGTGHRQQAKGKAQPSCPTAAAVCDAAASGCEACLDECAMLDCGDFQPLHYQAAGCEGWDPLCAMPGLEEAEKRAGLRRQEETADEFREIVRLLDLKRCPKCCREWSAKGAADHTTPLLREDSTESSYSNNKSLVVTYKGKDYQMPFAELINKAISLCPYCHPGGAQRPQQPMHRPTPPRRV
mmetsp:Transcript_42850/g.96769  ORF Transcript_42850/g.96769 Transcript_42850/m.96769 type:complete len:222 (-) Transcript_42850:72-737(-)